MLDSCTKYQDYVELSVQNGAKALSISEHGKPLNWTEKWDACKKAGLRYIHSVEIYLTESLDEKVRDNYHTVLMARNLDGIRELNALVSKSCDEEHFYYTNRISFDEFLNMSNNIISTSACLASPLNKLPDSHPRYMELAQKYDFLEVQAHNHPEQIEFNKRLLALSKKIGTPLIAGTDTHSSTPYKAECRAVLLSAKHKSYGDEDAFDADHGVAHAGVDGIGEVDGGRAGRQGYDTALGGEDEHFVIEHIDLQRLDVFVSIAVLLAFQQTAHPFKVLFFAGTGILLVLPVGGDAVFGGLVHIPGADLHLKGDALLADHSGVQALVHIGLGGGDVVLEPARHQIKQVVDMTQHIIAIRDGVYNDPEGVQIVQLVDALALGLGLAVDGINVLDAAVGSVGDAHIG